MANIIYNVIKILITTQVSQVWREILLSKIPEITLKCMVCISKPVIYKPVILDNDSSVHINLF
jgi:hypothetical protein